MPGCSLACLSACPPAGLTAARRVGCPLEPKKYIKNFLWSRVQPTAAPSWPQNPIWGHKQGGRSFFREIALPPCFLTRAPTWPCPPDLRRFVKLRRSLLCALDYLRVDRELLDFSALERLQRDSSSVMNYGSTVRNLRSIAQCLVPSDLKKIEKWALLTTKTGSGTIGETFSNFKLKIFWWLPS